MKCSMQLKKVCPQCSAVYKQRKEVLRCDCGHELPYKRKVAIVYYDVIRIDVIVKFFT